MTKFPKKRAESGQALAELCAMLVALCVVMLGMLFVALAGRRGVENIVRARGEADRRMAQGAANGSARHITYWANISSGQGDGLQFTADDKPVAGSRPDSTPFKNALETTGSFSMNTAASNANSGSSFSAFALGEGNLFVMAANLTSGQSETTPFSSDAVSNGSTPTPGDMKRIFAKFGISTDFSISDTVFMPIIPLED